MRPGQSRFDRRYRAGSAAFLAYFAVSFLYFGVRLLTEPGGQYIGVYNDPQIPIWSFAWWPHALLHGINPFFTHAVWSPAGVNLAWANTIPAVSIAFIPLTLAVGPIASFNVAAMALPALSAWAAYLLCRHVTRRWWPALVGGYLFGFSSYVLGHMTGQPQLTAAFAIPLLALVVLRFVEGSLGKRRLVALAGLLVALQLLISMEVAFTLTIVLAGALVLGYLFDAGKRARIVAAIAPLAGGYVIALVIASPFLYYALTAVRISGFQTPSDFVADLLNLFVPTHLEAAGAGWLTHVSRRFPGNYTEQGAYLGLPALLILALFARSRWRTSGGRFLLVSVVAVFFLSLGPELTVGGHGVVPLPTPFGHETVTLPGLGTKFLPLFDNALPVRFALYTALAAAVMVALWMASRPAGDVLLWVLPALTIVLVLPNPAAKIWATDYRIPPFFTDAAYRSCLGPGEVILPQPVRGGGPSMLWQVSDDFRFDMAGGRLQTSPPTTFLHPPSIAQIAEGNAPVANQSQLLTAYFRAKGVTSAIVDKDHARRWAPALDRIAKRQDVGGVLLYRVSGPARPCPSR